MVREQDIHMVTMYHPHKQYTNYKETYVFCQGKNWVKLPTMRQIDKCLQTRDTKIINSIFNSNPCSTSSPIFFYLNLSGGSNQTSKFKDILENS